MLLARSRIHPLSLINYERSRWGTKSTNPPMRCPRIPRVDIGLMQNGYDRIQLLPHGYPSMLSTEAPDWLKVNSILDVKTIGTPIGKTGNIKLLRHSSAECLATAE